jgi:hypothetical protein
VFVVFVSESSSMAIKFWVAFEKQTSEEYESIKEWDT